jgi:hypothetical protein
MRAEVGSFRRMSRVTGSPSQTRRSVDVRCFYARGRFIPDILLDLGDTFAVIPLAYSFDILFRQNMFGMVNPYKKSGLMWFGLVGKVVVDGDRAVGGYIPWWILQAEKLRGCERAVIEGSGFMTFRITHHRSCYLQIESESGDRVKML